MSVSFPRSADNNIIVRSDGRSAVVHWGPLHTYPQGSHTFASTVPVKPVVAQIQNWFTAARFGIPHAWNDMIMLEICLL